MDPGCAARLRAPKVGGSFLRVSYVSPFGGEITLFVSCVCHAHRPDRGNVGKRAGWPGPGMVAFFRNKTWIADEEALSGFN